MPDVLDYFNRFPPQERAGMIALVVTSLAQSPADEVAIVPPEAQHIVDLVKEELANADPQAQSRLWDFFANEVGSQPADDSVATSRLVRRGLLRPSAYQIVIGNTFKVYARPSVTASVAMAALADPDMQQVIGREEVVVLCTALRPGKTRESDSTLIVCGKLEKEQRLQVIFALRAHHAVVNLAQSKTPVDVLRAFVNRYGAPFWLNRKEMHLFIEHMVAPSPIEMGGHRKGAFTLQMILTHSPLGVSEVNLAFCLDKKLYDEDLARYRS